MTDVAWRALARGAVFVSLQPKLDTDLDPDIINHILAHFFMENSFVGQQLENRICLYDVENIVLSVDMGQKDRSLRPKEQKRLEACCSRLCSTLENYVQLLVILCGARISTQTYRRTKVS